MPPETLALIGAIETAFEDIERGDGVSIHEAREIDCHASRIKRASARAKDTDRSWQEVPADSLARNMRYLCFLDAKGMRYYLPALMTWYLRNGGQFKDAGELIDTLCTVGSAESRRQFSLLSAQQSHVVLRFLRRVAELENDFSEDIQSACRLYWEKYDT